MQVVELFKVYFVGYFYLKVLVVYGGMDFCFQISVFRCGVDVVVGIFGWVMDYMCQGIFDISGLCSLVFDEVDEMFCMGFIDDVEWIFDQFLEQ